MDDSQKRMSGIPRLSKLPRPTSLLPRPTSVVRPSPSRESLGSVGELRNPRLRASASTNQLRSSANITSEVRNPRLRNSISRDQLNSNPIRSSFTKPPSAPSSNSSSRPGTSSESYSRPGTAQRPKTPSQNANVIPESPLVDPTGPPMEDPDRPLFRRRLTLTRRPSEVYAASPLDYMPTQDPLVTFHRVEDGRSTGTIQEEFSYDGLHPPADMNRPSLAERTMETLASLPSSPAMSRKSSNYHDGSRSRSRADSNSSRPGSSNGSFAHGSRPTSRADSGMGLDDVPSNLRVAANSFNSSLSPINGTSSARRVSGIQPIKAPSRVTPGRIGLAPVSRRASSAMPQLSDEKSPSPAKKTFGALPAKPGAKTMSARTVKPRASVNGLYKKPSLQAMNKTSQDSVSSKKSGWDGTIVPPSSDKDMDESSEQTAAKSSSALREQIAKARAAKKAAMNQTESKHQSKDSVASIVPQDDGFKFGVVHDDPFNLRKGENPKKKVLNQRVSAGRSTGRLNVAALGLKEIPVEVLKMYDLESIGTFDGSWAESVDLTRFVVADNEIEKLDDFIFPDTNPENFDEEQASQGSIFCGLETLDVHGNLLVDVPIGLRRLTQLTSLNLASNRLQNNCLDTIAQISSLRDLKLGKNLFFGPLNPALSNLHQLEILDVHGNNISALPPRLAEMSRLRILNLSENSFESLPFHGLAQLPLTELNARKNKLSGTLIEDAIESFPLLQSLDVSTNQLTRFVPLGASISLPVLHSLSLSMNRLQGLPDMTTWINLLTLTVDENSISGIPNSFTGLNKLRHADFSGNDIRMVPPEVSSMENLSMLRLHGNPLRDKKFLSISTEEVKDILASRIEPPPPYQAPAEEQVAATEVAAGSNTGGIENKQLSALQQGVDDAISEDSFATPPTSAPGSPDVARSKTMSGHRSRAQTLSLSSQTWPVKPGGTLDRSRTESSSLHPVVCSKIAVDNQIQTLFLGHNLFASFPNSMSFFAETLSTLSLSHNQLMGETYLNEELELPALKELNISNNRVSGLGPLTKFLQAPHLDKMDVSMNRVSVIPSDLMQAFPNLTVLLMANNQLMDIEPETIKGLKIVDASNNEISHLNPRLGLLGGPGGLARLDVMGNRFRVPRFNVLERGTDATLRWLRGRVPVSEMSAWKGGEDEPEVD